MSSQLTDRAQALQVALSYERAAALAKQKRLGDAQARKVLREIQMLAGIEALEVESVGSFLERRRMALRARFKAGRTLERYLDVIDRFLKFNGELANAPLTEVSRRVASEWRDALLAVPLSASTVNHHLTTLTREFKEAKLQELISDNPWEGVRVKNAKRDRQQRRAFTWAQFGALLQATAPGGDDPVGDAGEWHLFIKIAGYMGQRRMDVARLRADQIDGKKRVVKFWRGKTKDWLEVPIHAALWPDIERAVKEHPAGLLMPALGARPVTGRNSLSDEFRQVILPRIGLAQPYRQRVAGEARQPRKLAEYSIHSLRHSLSTWLNDAGVSQVDRMQIVGHADEAVSRGYTHAGLEHARRALEKLPKMKRFDRGNPKA